MLLVDIFSPKLAHIKKQTTPYKSAPNSFLGNSLYILERSRRAFAHNFFEHYFAEEFNAKNLDRKKYEI